MTDHVMTDAERKDLKEYETSQVLKLVERVTSSLKGREEALTAIARLTGTPEHVTMSFIDAGMKVSKGDPALLHAQFMAVGAILAAEFAGRLVSIERAKHALPDYVTGNTTQAVDDASKGGQ